MLLVLVPTTTLFLELIVLEDRTDTDKAHGLVERDRVLRSLKAYKVIVARTGGGHVLQLLNGQGHQGLVVTSDEIMKQGTILKC